MDQAPDRYAFHNILKTIVSNVYFQPPENYKITYPCIVYKLSGIKTDHSDDKIYKKTRCYDVTVICRDPDNDYADKLLDAFPMASFSKRYLADNLYHDALTIYYKNI